MTEQTIPLSELISTKPSKSRTIKVDMREPDEVFEMLKKQAPEFDMKVERDVLETGDYVFKDVGVERKESDFREIDDVLIKAEELSKKYKKSYVFISTDLQLLIENEKINYSKSNVSSIRGLVASLIERGVYPIFASNKKNFVRVLLKTFHKHADEKNRQIQEPIRPEPKKSDWQTHILCGLPKVGEGKADALLEHFDSVRAVVNASEEELREVEGIGPTISEKIKEVVEP